MVQCNPPLVSGLARHEEGFGRNLPAAFPMCCPAHSGPGGERSGLARTLGSPRGALPCAWHSTRAAAALLVIPEGCTPAYPGTGTWQRSPAKAGICQSQEGVKNNPASVGLRLETAPRQSSAVLLSTGKGQGVCQRTGQPLEGLLKFGLWVKLLSQGWQALSCHGVSACPTHGADSAGPALWVSPAHRPSTSVEGRTLLLLPSLPWL